MPSVKQRVEVLCHVFMQYCSHLYQRAWVILSICPRSLEHSWLPRFPELPLLTHCSPSHLFHGVCDVHVSMQLLYAQEGSTLYDPSQLQT